MTFREQLKKLEQAWKTCKNPHWMIWVLTKTDLDLIDPLCTMVENVLLDKETVCLNAIAAARRRAPEDELKDVYIAIDASGTSYLHVAAGCLARYAINRHAAYASCIPTYAASYVDGMFYDKEKWGKKQCNILRKYITVDQVKEAFNKLVS